MTGFLATHFRTALFIITGLSLAWGFRLMLFDHAPVAFNSAEEDMSFAWYVPVFSAYVLWVSRERIRSALSSPSWSGLSVAIPGALLGFLGVRGLQLRFEIVGFVLLVIGLVWTFYGRGAARAIAFPALFLLFCLPLATFLDVVTVHLRLLAVSVSQAILVGVGADVVREGTMLAAADGSFSIDVAAPCSGLRSLFAMMALTAGYAYFNQPSWPRRALLFALSVPIAIAGNIARILSIAFVASCFSSEFALGFYHDYSGYVVFVCSVALMLGASALISRVPSGSRGPTAAPASAGAVRSAGMVLPVVAAIAFTAFEVVQGTSREATLAEIGEVGFAEIPGFESRPVAASEAELKTLPADTVILHREYASPHGVRAFVSAVTGGRSKSSIHRPELCLPSQGFQMSAPRTVEAGGRSWRVIDLARRSETALFAYTFFNQEGFRTSSHVERIFRDVCDRSFRNRIDRWVMVTATIAPGDPATALRTLESVGRAIR